MKALESILEEAKGTTETRSRKSAKEKYYGTVYIDHTSRGINSWTVEMTPRWSQKYHQDAFIPRGYNITERGTSVVDVPAELSNLIAAIEKSKYILALEDDYDDEGSEGYEFETWSNAIRFLTAYAKHCYETTAIAPPPPFIYHGPDGSIDIQWREAAFRLLINIPKGDIPATFFGRSKGQEVSGVFDSKNPIFELFPLISGIV